MLDSPWVFPLLCLSAFLAGIVNAVAGGGTLLTFSGLLTLLSPVAANATSTLALLPGSMAAGFGFRTEVSECRQHLVHLWPPSVAGGIVGSLLLIRMPERAFANAVPWLLVAASILLLIQRPILRWLGTHPNNQPRRGTLVAVILFQFLVGVYGGYFGAGIGILMLSSLAFMGIPNIHHMNAVKNILAITMNGITAIIFIVAGIVVWKYAAVMAIASVLGGYTGARAARQMRPHYVRGLVVCIGFGVAAYSWLSR
jgi:uncharacterized membrane protein YfcA